MRGTNVQNVSYQRCEQPRIPRSKLLGSGEGQEAVSRRSGGGRSTDLGFRRTTECRSHHAKTVTGMRDTRCCEAVSILARGTRREQTPSVVCVRCCGADGNLQSAHAARVAGSNFVGTWEHARW
eukprot:3936202-Pyramimonas_sp.AAC.1